MSREIKVFFRDGSREEYGEGIKDVSTEGGSYVLSFDDGGTVYVPVGFVREIHVIG